MMRRESPSLTRISAFAGLPSELLRSIEQRCQWLDITGDQPIVDHGSGDDDVFFLVEGKATALLLTTASSRIVALCEIAAGQMIGELSAIDGRPRSATVVTDTPCVVARLPGAAFRQLLEQEPLVLRAVLRHLTCMVRSLTARVFELSVLTVPGRLQAELLRIALDGELNGDTAFVPRLPTHTELASRIATAREVVSREIGKLDRMGIIERQGTSMRVPSLARLDEIVRAAVGEADDSEFAIGSALKQHGRKLDHGRKASRVS